MNGARYEQAILGRFYETVVARWMAIVWRHGRLTWITNASGPMIQFQIVPLLFAAPKYLVRRPDAGPGHAARRRLRAGADRHLVGGRQLQPRRRVVRLGAPRDGHRHCLRRDRQRDSRRRRAATTPGASAGRRRARRHRRRRRQRPVRSISNASLAVGPGETVHISGESSTGKSVLVRVLAGLWPCAQRQPRPCPARAA